MSPKFARAKPQMTEFFEPSIEIQTVNFTSVAIKVLGIGIAISTIPYTKKQMTLVVKNNSRTPMLPLFGIGIAFVEKLYIGKAVFVQLPAVQRSISTLIPFYVNSCGEKTDFIVFVIGM